MVLISHRGNVNGPIESKENHPDYIMRAIRDGYNVEVDLWHLQDKWYLGHDEPTYDIDFGFIFDNKNSLWVHAKNLSSLYNLNLINDKKKWLHYFWHQNDNFTLTSTGFVWTYPGQELTNHSICVKPESVNYTKEQIKDCYGVCSDFIKNYR